MTNTRFSAVLSAATLIAVSATATAQIDGSNVTHIGAGHNGRITTRFDVESNINGKTTWAEISGGRTRFKFLETGRDKWSVYLLDSKRKVTLRLDLYQKKVVYTSTRRPFPIFDVIRTESKPAQTTWQSKSKWVGKGKFKARLKAGAKFHADQPAGFAEVGAYGGLIIKALGYRGDLVARLYGNAGTSGQYYRVGFSRKIELNGKAIIPWKRELVMNGTLSKGYDAFPKDIKYRVSIGPIPVTIKGNVGVNAALSGSVQRFDAQKIEMRGRTGAGFYASGWLDVSAAEIAGVRGELAVGRVDGTADVTVNPRRLRATLKVKLTAVALEIYAYVRYWWFGLKEKRFSIVDWSSKPKTLASYRFDR